MCDLGYPWLELLGAQPFDTAMGLQPTWVLVCTWVWEPVGIPSHTPLEDYP